MMLFNEIKYHLFVLYQSKVVQIVFVFNVQHSEEERGSKDMLH